MMELRHLAYFRVVAEVGSIAKAAAVLKISQPTLSRQIAYLERSTGYSLLARSSRGTVLTPAGEAFHEHIRRIFVQVDQVQEVLRAAKHAHRLVRLGLPAGVPGGWFTAFERRLSEGAPEAVLSLHEATSAEQRRLLRSGVIDIGLLHVEPPELHSRFVLSQRFGAAVRANSELAVRSSLTLSEFRGKRVMAHSTEETPGLEARLRAAPDGDGVDWLFRRFSEHSALIAESARADVVFIAEVSASRHFPGWIWIPMHRSMGESALIRTWAAWSDPELPDLDSLLRAMAHASKLVSSSKKRANTV